MSGLKERPASVESVGGTSTGGGAERGSTCEAESVRLKVRLSALVAQLQLIVRFSGPSSSSTEKEAHEGIREGERHSMCSCSIGTLPVGSADEGL